MEETAIQKELGWPIDHTTQESVERWLVGSPILDKAITKVIPLVNAPTVITDASIGNIFTLTTTQNFTMANPLNPVNGKIIIYKIKQDSTGSRVITWGSAFRAASVNVSLTNLVSYWKFDESSGNAVDSYGSNTLVNNGTVGYVAAKINNGADLELGTPSYFSITDASQSGLDLTASLSFSLWVKFESFGTEDGNGSYLIDKQSTGGQISYLFNYEVNNSISRKRLYFTSSPDGSAAGTVTYVEGLALSTGTWYHLVFTKTGIDFRFYVNGEARATTSSSSDATIFNGTSPFRIGTNSTNSSLDGIIDEVAIFSRAITAAEVTALYNSGSGNAYPLSTAASLPILNVRANYVDYFEFIYDSVADKWNLLNSYQSYPT